MEWTQEDMRQLSAFVLVIAAFSRLLRKYIVLTIFSTGCENNNENYSRSGKTNTIRRLMFGKGRNPATSIFSEIPVFSRGNLLTKFHFDGKILEI